MSYPGGKNASGLPQWIVAAQPTHTVYCEPFLGHGAVMRNKPPALRPAARLVRDSSRSGTGLQRTGENFEEGQTLACEVHLAASEAASDHCRGAD